MSAPHDPWTIEGLKRRSLYSSLNLLSQFSSLEALATFIEQQKAVLASTQFTIDALRRLKTEAIAADVGSLADQLSGNAFRLSEQVDRVSQVPESIDWALFAEKGTR
ncbi:hypothetical protein B0H19DRAFT_200566 [Mycena capillaripes]|nr:hypothetical protein B0H19DRAFT_200566 [Mycena capillaripes]